MPGPNRTVSHAVTMPDGTVIPDVPEGTTQEDLWEQYQAYRAQQTPMEGAQEKRQQDVMEFQAQKQREYEQRIGAWNKLVQENPNYAGPSVMQEPSPPVEPLLQFRKPPLPPSPVQKFGTATKLDLVDDMDTKRQMMAQSLFPNNPEGIDRVGFFEGKPVYVDDDGNLQQLTSGLTRFGASQLANAPENAGAILGGLTGGWWGAPLGASGAHVAKRYVASKIFDEPLDPLGLAKSTAIEGGSTLLGEGLGRGITGLANKGTYLNMSRAELRRAEDVVAKAKAEFDIDLDLAQASGNRRAIALRGFAGRSPTEAADLFQAADEAAAGKFEVATRRVLDRIAQENTAENTGKAGISTAKLALKVAKKRIRNLVGPDYEAAYAKAPIITDPEILKFLHLPYFPQAFKRGQVIAELEQKQLPTVTAPAGPSTFTREKTPWGYRMKEEAAPEQTVQVPDLRSLDYTKQGLDDVIEKLREKNPKLAGALQVQRNAFVDALDKIALPEYRKARLKYRALYDQQVAPLENGPVGVLANIKDPDQASAAAKIFTDPTISASQIRQARRAIQAQNPQAWDDLVRTYLAQALNTAKRETKSGVELNVPGKFRNEVYSDPDQRARMRVILPPDVLQTFDSLMEKAKLLGSTPLAGSVTKHDTEIKEIAKGRGASALKWFFTPRKRAIDVAEEAALDKGTVDIARALLNPQKRQHINRILRMNPSVRQAILISSVVGARSVPPALEAAFPNEPDTAPFAQ